MIYGQNPSKESRPIQTDSSGRLLLGGDAVTAPGSEGTTAMAVQQVAPKLSTATIANGASLSDALDLGTLRPGRLVMPAAWTAAAISFDVSADGVTYGPLYDQYGVEVSISSANAVASRQIVLDPPLFLSVRYLKVRSGLNGAAVNQGAARAIGIVGA